MKKRGFLISLRALLSIIASGMIVIAFVLAGKSYGSQEAFYKLAIAKDLALTIDLMYALPGDVEEYTYPNDVSGYDIEMKDNKIRVYKYNLGKFDRTIQTYGYVGINSDSININIQDMKFVQFHKTNNKITVTGKKEW